MGNLIYAIVHELKKDANASPSIYLRESLLPYSPSLDLLFNELLSIFHKKTTKGFGRFDNDENTYPFSKNLRDYLQINTGVAFIDFSKKSLEHLNSRISSVNLAIGGYVLFLLYENDNSEKIY